jgi:predicted nucleotidyltransferase
MRATAHEAPAADDWQADPILMEARRGILEAFRPCRIYLFGSRAWGTPAAESDHDLLVVVDEEEDERRLAGRMTVALWGLGGAFDIVVRTRSWWDAWSDTPCSLEERIATEGVVLHDAP